MLTDYFCMVSFLFSMCDLFFLFILFLLFSITKSMMFFFIRKNKFSSPDHAVCFTWKLKDQLTRYNVHL